MMTIRFQKKAWCSILSALILCNPLIASADTTVLVGNIGPITSTITILDANAQRLARASGAQGANEVAAAQMGDCGDKMNKAKTEAAQAIVVAATPPDPVKSFNDSISECLKDIQAFQFLISIPSISSISITAIIDALMQQLMEKIMAAICKAATGVWNSAVGNAINTVNTGINQSGINTFGTVISASGGTYNGSGPLTLGSGSITSGNTTTSGSVSVSGNSNSGSQASCPGC